MSLRSYQREALDTVKREYLAGTRRMVLALCTGSGKTVIFSNLPQELGEIQEFVSGQMIVLAHRDELIQQAADKMRHWNPTLKIGIEMADEYADEDCDIVIASVATLGRAGTKRLSRFDKDLVNAVVVDECHHAVATTYMNVFNHFGLLEADTEKLLVGVTATTGRGDGQGLVKVFQKVAYSYTTKQAIEDGWLADVRAIRLKTATGLDSVRTTAGEFNQGDLASTVNTPKRNQQIVKAWLTNETNGRQTVAFTAGIQHAKDLADMFEQHGVSAAAVWGDDPQREAKLELHRRGQIKVLCNDNVLTEGYDDWRIACVIMARPTKSQGAFIQRAGRGTRIEDGIGNLKEALANGVHTEKRDCIILDVVDSTHRHSLVTLPSIFGLNANMDLKGKSAFTAMKKLEKAQEEHPKVDFSALEDIDAIDATVEQTDIWNVKFPLSQESELSWHRAFDGSYVLLLPKQERVTIKQNPLGYEIFTELSGQKYRGVRETLEEAVRAADNLVANKATEAMRVLAREADWHGEPITGPQQSLLKKLLKGKPIPDGTTKGNASKLIGQLMASKVQTRQGVRA